MQRFLATPDHEAYFDFMSLIVVLSNYESRHLADIQRAIAWEPGHAIDARASDFRALLKHEVTHFLDTTTTEWGGEYTFRKLQLLHQLGSTNEELPQAARVFAINTGELEIHSTLIAAGSVPPASCDTIKHQLIYHDDYGVCLIVHYYKAGELCHKVPLSMLSLLEANATASEFLSLIQCAESNLDVVERRLAMEEVHRRFEVLLNDANRMEYSVLLHFTRVHFKQLELPDLLKLIAAIARFSLDSPTLTTSTLANTVQRSFQNRELGDSISMELRRGAQRHLLFFKTVFFIYRWLEELGDNEREIEEATLRVAPAAAIRRSWGWIRGEELTDDLSIRNLFSGNQEERLCEFEVELADHRIWGESSRVNRALLETTSAGLLSFKSLKLLNGLLADDTEVVFPNSIDIRVPEYSSAMLVHLSKLDATYRKMKHARNHIPPGAPSVFRFR